MKTLLTYQAFLITAQPDSLHHSWSHSLANIPFILISFSLFSPLVCLDVSHAGMRHDLTPLHPQLPPPPFRLPKPAPLAGISHKHHAVM